MDHEITFGSFFRAKRLEKKLTLRNLAEILKLSHVYISNIENERRPAPKGAVLDRLPEIFGLNKEETELMYDLAAQSRERVSVSGDLPEYIMEKDIVRVALRTAKDVDATDEEWQEFIEKLKNRIVPDSQD